jgi:hypothetical protein
VLVLRDVCDLSVRETAEALELSEAVVKTTHHRARAALLTHDARDRVPMAVNARALEAFLVHVGMHNEDALRALLAGDIVELHDGAGEYFAAQRPIRGIDKVLRFYRKAQRPMARVLYTSLNGQAALLVELVPRRPREPVRAAIWIYTDRRGRVVRTFVQVADRKLAALPWERARSVGAALLLLSPRLLRSAWSTPEPSSWWLPALRRGLRVAARLPSR